MGSATKLRDLPGWRGVASLYRLDPPMILLDEDEGEGPVEYVIVSATDVEFSGPETYLFPSNVAGEVLSWVELEGSFRGGLDHVRALDGAGYTVVMP